VRREEDAVKEALSLWEERERARAEILAAVSLSASLLRARPAGGHNGAMGAQWQPRGQVSSNAVSGPAARTSRRPGESIAEYQKLGYSIGQSCA
jgi:hypothetical protein